MFGFAPTLRRAFMSSTMKAPPLQGILGIHKPAGISSAQVLRDVEEHFNPSALFRPLLDAQRDAIEQQARQQGNRRRRGGPNRSRRVKLGHGGTLDPLATGVLIAGVGSGTKALGRYLGGCQKTYEAALVFGCATDTYDNTGKVLARAPHAHVTRDAVERALAAYRGDIMQKPPVYSALKFNGKKAYEIMREGGEPPKMEPRPVTVHKLELVEWCPAGTHSWRYPQEEMEASAEEKQAALKATVSNVKADGEQGGSAAAGDKRKREENESAEEVPEKKSKTDLEAEPVDGTATAATSEVPNASEETVATDTAAAPLEDGSNAPAARIRMTVSSGFYVRTLCHDLGAAVGSLACMTALVRTEQGDFELGKNVLEYEDLKAGEAVWGPKVKTIIEDWQAREEREQPKQTSSEASAKGENSKSHAKEDGPKSPAKRERSKSPKRTESAGPAANRQRSKSPQKPAKEETEDDDIPEMD